MPKKVQIKFWYSSDGTPNFDKESINKLQASYLRLENLTPIRKYFRKCLVCLYQSFKSDGEEITEGKLEFKIKDKK